MVALPSGAALSPRLASTVAADPWHTCLTA